MENVLILGAKGMLGGELRNEFPKGIFWDREDVDVTDFQALGYKISIDLKYQNRRPEAIINCVAFNDVDGAEEREELAYKLNTAVPAELAKICNVLKIPLVHFSTNYVFDGEKGEYREEDQPNPLSVYGRSKHQGEQAVQKNTKQYYLFRTAVLFGPKGESEVSKKSFVDIMLDLSRKSGTIKAVEDEVNSITYVQDLAAAVKSALENNLPYGLYHATNAGAASWYDFAGEIFKITNRQVNLIPVASTEFPRAAKRPRKAVLINTKLPEFRPWQAALAEFLGDYES